MLGTTAGGELGDERRSLRRATLSFRQTLSEQEMVAWSNVIQASALEVVRALDTRLMHCYLDFRSEVRTRGLIASLLADGREVVVPVVRMVDGEEVMRMSRIQDLTDLRHGAYGIDEPSTEDFESTERVELAFMPLAAFDQFGMRLGYGKGFYDKFLASVPHVLAVGLAFSVQELPRIPRQEHDQLLDLVITEEAIIECSPRGRALMSKIRSTR